MNILTSSLKTLRDAIHKGELKSEDATAAYQKQIEKWNPKLNAFITLNENALEQAKKVDEAIAKKQHLGPLAGVPIAIKDMLCTKGLRTTAGSRILENFIPPYSATVVNKLEAAGAINLGKTNQDEFAMGSSTENSYYSISRNPWNTDYVPGGSSGGSSAAVSGGLAAAAIGTDTGGSIRQPASFCGIVGIKPTYGRVSRYGIIAYASSLDQAGPMTRTVEDAAIMLEAISGQDAYDGTTSEHPVPRWGESIDKNLKGIKVGLPKEYFSPQVSEEVHKVVEKAIAAIRAAGAETVEISLPLTDQAVSIYYLVATSEASSNLARYDGVRFGRRADFSAKPAEDLAEFYCRTRGEGFGPEVKRRIILGTYALSSGYYDAYYKKACQVRRLMRQQFVEAFTKCQVILGPVCVSPAFKIGERSADPLKMYLNDIFTTSANLVGIPGMSVPGGFSTDGLPIGVQLLSSHFQEQNLFNVGSVIEEAAGIKELPNVLK